MEKFNNGKLFTSSVTDLLAKRPHGKDSGNKFTLCPFGKSGSLPFCDGCSQQVKPKSAIK